MAEVRIDPMSEAREAAGWAHQAEAELASAGYRRGAARRAVLELLARQRCALSAFDIEDALRDQSRSVARASIYRILDQLERLSLVQRVETGQGVVRYEPVRQDHEHHHHLVCDRCGRLVPFTDADLERAIGRLSRRVAFDVSDHDVVLHGACATCSR